MKRTIIPIIMCILLLPIIQAEITYCYHDALNETSCEAVGQPYNIETDQNIDNSSFIIDVDNSTRAVFNSSAVYTYQINTTTPPYTQTDNTTFTVLWQSYLEENNTFTEIIPEECLNTFLYMNITYLRPFTGHDIKVDCMNSSGQMINFIYENVGTINYLKGDYLTWKYDKPARLNITFTTQTDAIIVNTNGIRNFTNTTNIYINVSELGLGDTTVYFNGNEGNWTQKYEFENDNETNIEQTMTLTTDSSVPLIFRTYDNAGMILDNVLIEIYHSKNATTTWQTFNLITQLLTDRYGKATMLFDENSHVYIVASKSGYDTFTSYFSIGELDTTADYTIQLNPNMQVFESWNTIYCQPTFKNRSNYVYGYIHAPLSNDMRITTDYLSYNEQLEQETLNFFPFTLTPNLHFNESGNTNITVYGMQGTTIFGNCTILYEQSYMNESTIPIDIFQPDIDNSSKLYRVLLLIAIIIISAVAGMMIKNEEIPYHTYLIGMIIISMINYAFLWVAGIIMLHYMLRGIYKVTGQ